MGQNLSYNKDEIYFYGTKWSSRIDLIDADDEYYNPLYDLPTHSIVNVNNNKQ